MVLHDAMEYQKNRWDEMPEEMLSLMPLDSFEAMPGMDGSAGPLPFFICSDDDDDDDDADDEDNFDDMEEDGFDDDDDDFEDDYDEDYEDDFDE